MSLAYDTCACTVMDVVSYFIDLTMIQVLYVYLQPHPHSNLKSQIPINLATPTPSPSPPTPPSPSPQHQRPHTKNQYKSHAVHLLSLVNGLVLNLSTGNAKNVTCVSSRWCSSSWTCLFNLVRILWRVRWSCCVSVCVCLCVAEGE